MPLPIPPHFNSSPLPSLTEARASAPLPARARSTPARPLPLRHASFCLGNQLFRLPWFQREVAACVPVGRRILLLWAALTAATVLLLGAIKPAQKRPKSVTQLIRCQRPCVSLLQVLHFRRRYKQTCPLSYGFVSLANGHKNSPRSCSWNLGFCLSVL